MIVKTMITTLSSSLINKINAFGTVIPIEIIEELFTVDHVAIENLIQFLKAHPDKCIYIKPIIGIRSYSFIRFNGAVEKILGQASIAAVLEEICPCKLDNGQIAVAHTVTSSDGSISTDIFAVPDDCSYQCKPPIKYIDLSFKSIIRRIVQLTEWKHLGQLDNIEQLSKYFDRYDRYQNPHGFDVLRLVCVVMKLQLWLYNYTIDHPNWAATTPADFACHFTDYQCIWFVAWNIITYHDVHNEFASHIWKFMYNRDPEITSLKLLTKLISNEQGMFTTRLIVDEFALVNPVD